MVSVPKTYNVVGITIIMSIGGFILGLDAASLTAFLSTGQFVGYFGQIGSMAQGLIAASNPIGAFAGCILCGSFCDTFGCIKTLQTACVIWMGGSLVSMFVLNIEMLTTGRVLKGISMGILSAVIPVYISETIPSGKKGSAMSIIQWSSTCGTLIMFFIGYGCSCIESDMSFRIAWGIEIVPSIVFLIACFFLPESPKWLASHSKWLEAANILDRLRNPVRKSKRSKQSGLDIDESSAKIISGDMDHVLDAFTSGNDIKSCTYADLFGKHLWKYTLIGTFTQIMSQLTGVNILMYLFVYICGMCGLEGNLKTLTTSMQYAVVVGFTIFPILMLDGCRRKDALVFGSFILGFAHAAIFGLMGYYGSEPTFTTNNINAPFSWTMESDVSSIVLAVCFYFVAVFASTISCTGWLYTGEIFPMKAKAKGSSVCMGVSWVFNASLTLISPLLFACAKYWTFALFSFFCFACCLAMILKFPETRDLSDLQIEALYQLNTPSHQPRRRQNKPSSSEENVMELKGYHSNPIVSPEKARLSMEKRSSGDYRSHESAFKNGNLKITNVLDDLDGTVYKRSSEESRRSWISRDNIPKKPVELSRPKKEQNEKKNGGLLVSPDKKLTGNRRGGEDFGREIEKEETERHIRRDNHNSNQVKNIKKSNNVKKPVLGKYKSNIRNKRPKPSMSDSEDFYNISDDSEDRISIEKQDSDRYDQTCEVMDCYTDAASSVDDASSDHDTDKKKKCPNKSNTHAKARYNESSSNFETEDDQGTDIGSESSDDIYFVKDSNGSPNKTGITYEPSGFLTGGQPFGQINSGIGNSNVRKGNTKESAKQAQVVQDNRMQSKNKISPIDGSKISSGENKLNSGGRKKRVKSKW